MNGKFQTGSVSAEWVVVCGILVVALFAPFINGESAAQIMFAAVQTALDNSAAIVSMP